MNLTEAIKDLQNGTKHYNLIVANQNSKESIIECKNLDFNNIVKRDISNKLNEELLDGLTKTDKKHKSWDLIEKYLDSIDYEIFVAFNVGYLFSPDLGNIDVINAFQYYSRDGRIIVLFIDGKVNNNYLSYSEEGLDDYKRMDISNVKLVGW